MTVRVDTEVGALRTVLLHRPGPELARLTPRNAADLLFDGLPWVERAQDEHDVFADTLRAYDVEVLYLRDLLVDVLAKDAARAVTSAAAVRPEAIGRVAARVLAAHLADLPPADLADTLIAGLRHDELPTGGLLARLSDPHDFVLGPLPNLLFTRDSSACVGDHIVVTTPSLPVRRRERSLTAAVFAHHPRFAGTPSLWDPPLATGLEGGDVLLLAPGVLAVGVGQRTTAAGVEDLAIRAFAAGLVQTLLIVPIAQERATMHLDTVVTMVDVDAVVMYPNVASSLMAYPVRAAGDGGVAVGEPEPFLAAAARAMDIPRLEMIETGLDPVTAEREQWDDGNNTLAVRPRLCVAYERNVRTNARLEEHGVEVLRVPGSELGTGRGGPRCMSAPLWRAEVEVRR